MVSAQPREGNRETGRYGKKVAPFGLRSDVWAYFVGNNVTTNDGTKHPALMPEEMAEDLIVSWSRPGELVFDPFAGGGDDLQDGDAESQALSRHGDPRAVRPCCESPAGIGSNGTEETARRPLR